MREGGREGERDASSKASEDQCRFFSLFAAERSVCTYPDVEDRNQELLRGVVRRAPAEGVALEFDRVDAAQGGGPVERHAVQRVADRAADERVRGHSNQLRARRDGRMEGQGHLERDRVGGVRRALVGPVVPRAGIARQDAPSAAAAAAVFVAPDREPRAPIVRAADGLRVRGVQEAAREHDAAAGKQHPYGPSR